MLLGVVFLSALDALLPHLRRDRTWQDASWRQTTLLMTAITLHNVPEGMAVGLAFALVSGGEGFAGAGGPGHGHRHPEFSGGSRRGSAPAAGRMVPSQGLCGGNALRRRGAGVRRAGGPGPRPAWTR